MDDIYKNPLKVGAAPPTLLLACLHDRDIRRENRKTRVVSVHPTRGSNLAGRALGWGEKSANSLTTTVPCCSSQELINSCSLEKRGATWRSRVPNTACFHFLPCDHVPSVSPDGDASKSSASVKIIGRPEFEFGMRTMPPPLAVLLDANGCKFFLAALRKAGRLERATCSGITILAPRNNAFYPGSLPSNRERHW